MKIEIEDFGYKPYRELWERQKYLFSSLIQKKKERHIIDKEYILIGEHTPVYTIGFHGNKDNLLYSEKRLSSLGMECIRIERGGDITFHGPGQLIAYPIIDLEAHHLGVKQYMELLEDCVIELLADYGIKGEKVEGATGVWIGKGTYNERKICAMGIKCSRFVTMHGLALNVKTDLSAFSAINPCGFIDKGVTSVAEEIKKYSGAKESEVDSKLSMEKVKERFIEIITSKLNRQI